LSSDGKSGLLDDEFWGSFFFVPFPLFFGFSPPSRSLWGSKGGEFCDFAPSSFRPFSFFFFLRALSPLQCQNDVGVPFPHSLPLSLRRGRFFLSEGHSSWCPFFSSLFLRPPPPFLSFITFVRSSAPDLHVQRFFFFLGFLTPSPPAYLHLPFSQASSRLGALSLFPPKLFKMRPPLPSKSTKRFLQRTFSEP